MPNKKLSLIILCSSMLVFLAGITSEVSLGDEVAHYRFAKAICDAGERVTFDPLYDSGSPLGYFYKSAPFWHISLALLWRLFGGVSFFIAQLYHTVYYALLVLFTYLLGKELYGKETGLYSALIAATIPAIVAFSILFYLDIPATSLSLLCLLLIVKRKFLWSGIILGLMCLTKRNGFFFVPAFFFLVLYQNKIKFGEKAKNLFCFCIPAFLAALGDFLWRENNLKSITAINGNIGLRMGGDLYRIKRRLLFLDWERRINEYLNSSLFDPADVIKYFGIVLLASLIIYLLYKNYKKSDRVLWIPVISYFLFFCYIFHPGSDIRYLLPIMPFLAILASKAIAGLINKRWFRISLVSLCLLQFGSTVLHVRAQRQIPEGITAGFSYLRDNTPTKSLVIYPEYTILEGANRRFAWAGTLAPVLNDIFWGEDEQKVKDLLIQNNIDYIAIKKSRVYDDSKIHHFGGYPKSFVERLPKLFFAKLVFENKDISIWQIE